jgi:hypothetical protein
VPIADIRGSACTKQKDRLAAVSPKSDQVFGSGGKKSGFAFPAPSKHTERRTCRSDTLALPELA